MANEVVRAEVVSATENDTFINEHGLDQVADFEVLAHDKMISVRQALKDCPPFRDFVVSMIDNLVSVPNRDEILLGTIRSYAARAPELPPEAKKK